MTDNTGNVRSSFFIWPLISILIIVAFKRYLLGYETPIYFDITTDLFIVATAFFLSLKRETAKWQRIASIAVIFLIFYNWLDACIIMSINARLTIDNVVGNYKYINVIPYFITWKMVLFTFSISVVPFFLRKKNLTFGTKPPTTNLLSYEALFILFLAYSTMHNIKIGGGGVVRVGDYSLTALKVTKDSIETVNGKYESLVQNIEDRFAGKPWENVPPSNNPKPNIVLVLSESLSGVDSKYTGGLFDRLPNIDNIQRDGIGMTSAVSNGKITAHGLASSMLGQQPLKTGGYPSIPAQFPVDKMSGSNIIAYAKKQGYKTIVISAGQPREWQGLSGWFQSLGFDEVYDKDSPEFANTPRFTWDAPPDEYMYKLALELMGKQPQPFLIMVETVSLHQPYILPDIKYKVGEDDLVNLVNYVDQTTFVFYEMLKKINFFDNGVFVLYGDHRRFEELSKEERENGGVPKWHERIVCSVVGKGIEAGQLFTTPFSLIDMNTFLHFVMNGEKIDQSTLLRANLGSRLSIGESFVATLADEANGEYLIRSDKYPPAFISIFGTVPFDEIPNETYKEATVYLIKNDEYVNKVLKQ